MCIVKFRFSKQQVAIKVTHCCFKSDDVSFKHKCHNSESIHDGDFLNVSYKHDVDTGAVLHTLELELSLI